MILRKSRPVPYAEGAFVDFHILSKCLNGTETITYITIDKTLPTTLTTKPEVNHIVYRSKIHYEMLSSPQANCTVTEIKPSQTVTPKKAAFVVNMSNMKVDRATGATTTHGAAPVPEATGSEAAGSGAAGRGAAGRVAAERRAAGRGAAGRGAARRGATGRGAAGRRAAGRGAAGEELQEEELQEEESHLNHLNHGARVLMNLILNLESLINRLNCAGDMSKVPNTILSLSKGRIVSRLHKEIMALKGRIPKPLQNNNYLTFKRMMMLVVKKRKLSAAKNEMLSDGPKSNHQRSH
jgi:hypothetical protein